MSYPSDEKRQFTRVHSREEVWDLNSGRLIGYTRNIGLQGAFIETLSSPWVPPPRKVRLRLGQDAVEAAATVLRTTAQGVGIRFRDLSRKSSKTLLRHVIGEVGHIAYRDVVERMHAAGQEGTKSVTQPAGIQRILEQGASSSFLLVAKGCAKRQQAKLYYVSEGRIFLRCDDPCVFTSGQDLFVLHTQEYNSFSFASSVRYVQHHFCDLDVPTRIICSERRLFARTPACGVTLHCSAQDGQPVAEHHVLESSEHGVGIRLTRADGPLRIGAAWSGGFLCANGKKRGVEDLVVRHVALVDGSSEAKWYRVGLSHGPLEAVATRSRQTVWPAKVANGLHRRLSRGLTKAVDGGTFAFYDKILPRVANSPEDFHVVNMKNASGKLLVGLLNTSWARTSAPVQAPLVIVTPGFGAKKETMGALAYTLTHAFREQCRDIAVLRIDGVNNVGESHKDPGCGVEGKETLRFSITDGIDDVVGAYHWARSNKLVEATEMIVISVSFSGVAVRHALAEQCLPDVSLWVPFVGVADAANAVMNVAGHVDGYHNFRSGIRNGLVSLMGNLTDGDHFCRNMHELRVATLDDAKREIENICQDIVWIAGTQDVYMDLRRTRRLMALPATGRRKLIELGVGHMPQSSEEALAVFGIVGGEILEHLGGDPQRRSTPRLGWVGARTEREWRRVRRLRAEGGRP